MWVVRLSDKQLEVLKALLRSEDHLGPALSRALESLELARWDELPDAQLPWGDITKRASEQGISEADVVWDLCGLRDRHKAKPAPAKKPKRRAPRAAKS
jgi:hypothetical protein